MRSLGGETSGPIGFGNLTTLNVFGRYLGNISFDVLSCSFTINTTAKTLVPVVTWEKGANDRASVPSYLLVFIMHGLSLSSPTLQSQRQQ